MGKITITKKNDPYNPEYEVGDIFEIAGTWYGGVHITGKSGVPVSLDKEEYTELKTESEAPEETHIRRDIREGDIVRHFKREWVSAHSTEYLYKGSCLCAAYGKWRKAGDLSGSLPALPDKRQTFCHVYGRGGQRKIPGYKAEIPVRKDGDVKDRHRKSGSVKSIASEKGGVVKSMALEKAEV